MPVEQRESVEDRDNLIVVIAGIEADKLYVPDPAPSEFDTRGEITCHCGSPNAPVWARSEFGTGYHCGDCETVDSR